MSVSKYYKYSRVLDFLCVLSQFVFRDNIAKNKYFFFFEWLFWRNPHLTCITNLNFPLLFPILCQACTNQSVKSVPGLAHKTLSDIKVSLSSQFQSQVKALRMKIKD